MTCGGGIIALGGLNNATHGGGGVDELGPITVVVVGAGGAGDDTFVTSDVAGTGDQESALFTLLLLAMIPVFSPLTTVLSLRPAMLLLPLARTPPSFTSLLLALLPLMSPATLVLSSLPAMLSLPLGQRAAILHFVAAGNRAAVAAGDVDVFIAGDHQAVAGLDVASLSASTYVN